MSARDAAQQALDEAYKESEANFRSEPLPNEKGTAQRDPKTFA